MRRAAAAALALAALAAPAPAHAGWVVVHTWPWTGCADAAAAVLATGGSALDAVVQGAAVAERDPAVESVGRGAHPDAAGEPTLDALVMDGDSVRIGAVGALRSVAGAVAAARLVLEHCSHTLLVGSQATDFASSFGGMPLESLASAASDAAYAQWQADGCQPGYWRNVAPASGCGPFQPANASTLLLRAAPPAVTPDMHDTLSIAAIDARGSVAAATSTNGLAFKLPGRVGDAAIPGSGNYARTGVGACGATGDGDVMMRFLPCYQVVESMRLGWSALDAAEDAIARMRAVEPAFTGALFALAADGSHAGAAHNWVFQYTARAEGDAAATVFTVSPRPGHVPRAPRTSEHVSGRASVAQLGMAAAAGALLAWAAAVWRVRDRAGPDGKTVFYCVATDLASLGAHAAPAACVLGELAPGRVAKGHLGP